MGDKSCEIYLLGSLLSKVQTAASCIMHYASILRRKVTRIVSLRIVKVLPTCWKIVINGAIKIQTVSSSRKSLVLQNLTLSGLYSVPCAIVLWYS